MYTYNELATRNPLSVLNEKNDVAHSREFIGSADFDYKVHGFEDLRLHATLAPTSQAVSRIPMSRRLIRATTTATTAATDGSAS